MSQYGMVDERIALLEEMYTRICEENGPADPALKACLGHGEFASRIWRILIKRTVGQVAADSTLRA
jgi:hypothetical protein